MCWSESTCFELRSCCRADLCNQCNRSPPGGCALGLGQDIGRHGRRRTACASHAVQQWTAADFMERRTTTARLCAGRPRPQQKPRRARNTAAAFHEIIRSCSQPTTKCDACALFAAIFPCMRLTRSWYPRIVASRVKRIPIIGASMGGARVTVPCVSWEVICFQRTVGQRSATMQLPIHKVVRTGNWYFCRRVRR